MKVHNPNNLPTMDYREWKPLQGNLKDLSTENYNKLKNVLLKRGYTVPAYLWFNKEDNQHYIIDAHQRQRVMLGEDMQPYEVPYILIEADNIKDAKAQLLEITSQYGTITQEGFDTYIAQAELPEAEMMESINFDALNWTQPEPEVEEDEAPEVDESEPPKSKLGEIYQLGRHRVMCGDALIDTYKLMDGKTADMVFTDPPYLMGFEGNVHADGSKSANAKHGAILNDKMSKFDGERFLFDMIEVIQSYCRGAFYVCFYRLGLHKLFHALQESDQEYKALIIWEKGNHTLSNSDYMSKYEPIVYGWIEEHNFYGDRSNFDVWNITRTSNNDLHPTMKPLPLVAKAIGNSSKKDDIVLDLFLGSGSTLIACEQTDRICYGMELDERYVDVCRRRYWKFVNNGDETGWEDNTPCIVI